MFTNEKTSCINAQIISDKERINVHARRAHIVIGGATQAA